MTATPSSPSPTVLQPPCSGIAAPPRRLHSPALRLVPVVLGPLVWLLAAGCVQATTPAGPAVPGVAGDLAARPDLQPLAAGVWWVAGAPGDANAANRGAISNLLVVADGRRTWALGSGPSPAYGRQLATAVQQATGRRITDVISPWARPELVLGATALPTARRWAHADVAAGMQARCAGCIERLARRLGEAASDLGSSGAPLPTHLLHGQSGRLGPWRWWRLQRSTSTSTSTDDTTHRVVQPVTVWHLERANLWAAPGLLWNDGAPDLRDSRLVDLLGATQALHALANHRPARRTPASAGPDVLWLGEQGPPAGPVLIERHLAYWRALGAAARAAWERGDSETLPAPALDGVEAAWLTSPRHALNWQRAWRDAEAQALADLQASSPQAASQASAPTSAR